MYQNPTFSYFLVEKIPTFSYFLIKIPTFSYFLDLSYYLTSWDHHWTWLHNYILFCRSLNIAERCFQFFSEFRVTAAHTGELMGEPLTLLLDETGISPTPLVWTLTWNDIPLDETEVTATPHLLPSWMKQGYPYIWMKQEYSLPPWMKQEYLLSPLEETGYLLPPLDETGVLPFPVGWNMVIN